MELDPHYFLVGNNCVASHCNRLLHVPHPSPFAWAFTCPDDFVRLVDNWDRMDWEAGPDMHKVSMGYMAGYYGGEFSPMPREFFWEGTWFDADGHGYPVLYPHLDLGTEKGRDTMKRRTDRMLGLMAGGAVPHFCLACDNSTATDDWPADRLAAFRERDNATVVWFGETPSRYGRATARLAMIPKLVAKGVIHA